MPTRNQKPDGAIAGPRTRSGRRPDWKPVFLRAMADSGNVSLAALAAGVSRSAAYAHAKGHPAFAAAWMEAREEALDLLEAEARRRALTSSDSLLMFLMRSYRPEQFRDSVNVHLDLRAGAARVAERLGLPVEEVLERVERKIRELD